MAEIKNSLNFFPNIPPLIDDNSTSGRPSRICYGKKHKKRETADVFEPVEKMFADHSNHWTTVTTAGTVSKNLPINVQEKFTEIIERKSENHSTGIVGPTIFVRQCSAPTVHNMKCASEEASLNLPCQDGMAHLSMSSLSQFHTDEDRPETGLSMFVRERLHSFTKDLGRRTNQMKELILKPPTPDRSSLLSVTTTAEGESKLDDGKSLEFFVEEENLSNDQRNNLTFFKNPRHFFETLKKCILSQILQRRILSKSIDPRRKMFTFWLATVSLCLVYNAFAIPLRAAYPYQTDENLPFWFLADYFSDFIYFFDLFVVKPRVRFMKGGLPIKNVKLLCLAYFNGSRFKFDLLSIFPTDFLYLSPNIGMNSLVRLNRLFKVSSYWEFFNLLDNLVKNPYAVRIVKTFLNLIYVIHVNSCVFYALSSWQGLGSNAFVYNGRGNAYIRCFYFATKLATSVGNTEDPTNVYETVFMLISWMKGVFIVAMLLGQIRDVVATATKDREEFRNAMDNVLAYCKMVKLSDESEMKVRDWFTYTWQEQKTLDENNFLKTLPKKLRTELAISVHYQALNKVQLFKDCDKALLRDLVLKLKPAMYLPGDYICTKGEIGKEMYIVSKGILEVIGGPDGTTVFATLKEGSVFGEVSLLAVGGGNRRTADVRSKGFSNLFVLSKDDLNEAIKDHPEAQKILKRKARKLLKKHGDDGQKEKVDLKKLSTLKVRPPTPKMLTTVAQVINPSGITARKLLKTLKHQNDGLYSKHGEIDSEIELPVK